MMIAKRIGVIGCFDFGKPIGGQQVKTQIIGKELKRQFGEDEVAFYDTQGKWRFMLRMPFVVLSALIRHKNIVFMPGDKGLRIMVPLLVLLNYLFGRKLHYVVIGGWLPELLERYPVHKYLLKKIDCIYVETELMKAQLDKAGFRNTIVMQNCKQLDILEPTKITVFSSTPYPLCTFSRVIKSKGIEDAIIAVNDCNRQLGKTVFSLDIYGMVQEQEWFETLMSQQPKEIKYRGMVGYDQSTATLHKYFALLFPTYYHGEGFAGTLIDAMAAGVPSIVSDWKFNAEIITDGKTGYVFPTHSTQELSNILRRIADHPETMTAMRSNCLQEAKKYSPEVVTKILKEQII